MNSLAPLDQKPLCTMGCGRSVFAGGYCTAHYLRAKRHGDPSYGGPLRQQFKKSSSIEIDDYLNRLMTFDTDDCVRWPFGKNNGYARVRGEYIHRRVCEEANGPPPSAKHEAAHSCGNSTCINHRHLRWATPKENCADRLIHGTHVLGEKCGTSKLKRADIFEIRRLHGTVSGADLSRMFGVGQMQISRIVNRQRWGWLDE